jgi:dUTP pyrophosphatase
MIADVRIQVARVGDVDVPLPRYQTDGSAGMDLHAATKEPIVIAPGARVKFPTGLAFAIPAHFEGQVRPRSGLAVRHGITVLNAPGTIDADYRGEVQVILINHGAEPFTVERGMRIAQLVISAALHASIGEAASLDETTRGVGGFGSTGIAPGGNGSDG